MNLIELLGFLTVVNGTMDKGITQFAKAEMFWLSVVMLFSILLGVWLAP